MTKTKEHPETKRLRKFHRLGKQVLVADKQSEPLAGGKQHRGVAKLFQKKLGLKRDQIEKARKFAAMYSDVELYELCCLSSNDGKRRITKCHTIRLLAVRSKRSRLRLAKQIVKYGWTVQRLGKEITKSGKRSQGGRPPNRPGTVDVALGQIERMARQWVKWSDMMMEDSDGGDVTLNDLPDGVARAATKMTKAAKAVAAQLPPLYYFFNHSGVRPKEQRQCRVYTCKLVV